MKRFQDRIDAGMQLAEKLGHYKNQPGVVLAIPRGGIPVAYMVAKSLAMPMDIMLTKKIGHPHHKEYAIGAASLDDFFVLPEIDVSPDYIQEELKKIRSRLREMQMLFIGDRTALDLKGKTVIIVDDGMATGNTMLVTVDLLKKQSPARIIVAVPVASTSAVRLLAPHVTEVISVYTPVEFYGVGAFYDDFSQLEDEDVSIYLDEMRQWKQAG